MSTILSERVVTTRNAHRCVGCCETIPIGAKAAYIAGVVYGDFAASYTCNDREEWLRQHPGYFDDDAFYEGDVATARDETPEVMR
ncbi:MAG: hypothetical protein ACYCYO_01700 [Bacilli bacterium]